MLVEKVRKAIRRVDADKAPESLEHLPEGFVLLKLKRGSKNK